MAHFVSLISMWSLIMVPYFFSASSKKKRPMSEMVHESRLLEFIFNLGLVVTGFCLIISSLEATLKLNSSVILVIPSTIGGISLMSSGIVSRNVNCEKHDLLIRFAFTFLLITQVLGGLNTLIPLTTLSMSCVVLAFTNAFFVLFYWMRRQIAKVEVYTILITSFWMVVTIVRLY